MGFNYMNIFTFQIEETNVIKKHENETKLKI